MNKKNEFQNRDAERRIILNADYQLYEKGVIVGLIANNNQLNKLISKNLLLPTKFMSAERIQEIQNFLQTHEDFFVNVTLTKSYEEAYIDSIEGCTKDEKSIEDFISLCNGFKYTIDRKKNWQYCQF